MRRFLGGGFRVVFSPGPLEVARRFGFGSTQLGPGLKKPNQDP